MKEEEKLVLAALLHDIGKFAWRTGWVRTVAHERYSKKLAEAFLPENFRDCLDLIGAHHERAGVKAEEEKLLWALRAADFLSSGEREKVAEKLDEEEKERPPLLIPIISEVFEEGPGDLSIPLEELKLDETIFPVKRAEAFHGDYLGLLRKFGKEAKKFRNSRQSFEHFLLTLLSFLHKYTWCMPSAYWTPKGEVRRDVPLYEHLRLTAALSLALYKCLDKEDLRRLYALGRERKWDKFEKHVASLIAGDVCGIQRFIYTVAQRKVALALKGRSIYLRLLADGASRWLLKRLELFPTNLIYCSGGNFLILSHVLKDEEFEKTKKEFEARLFDIRKGGLYIALAKTDLRPSHFIMPEEGPHPLSGALQELWGEGIARAKGRKFASLLREKDVFDLGWEGGSEEKGFCRVCRSEEDVKDSKILELYEEAAEVCGFCERVMELAVEARNARFLIMTPRDATGEGIEILDFRYRFAGEEKDVKQLKTPAVISILNDTNFLPENLPPDRAYTFDFLNVLAPIDEKGIKPFEKMAEGARRREEVAGEERDYGLKRLGVLKLDGDNIADIFEKGLGGRLTLGRFAALSSALRLFFEGYVEKLARDISQEDIYTIYSGGDDLLFVGPWNKMLDLAMKIREAYRSYCCWNPKFTLSGGLFLSDPHYPLYLMTHEAGRLCSVAKGKEKVLELRRLKNGRIKGEEIKGGKNSLAFLERVWGWEEIEEARGLCEDLRGIWRESPHEVRPLLILMQRAFEEWRLQEREERKFMGRWCWFLTWHIARRGDWQRGGTLRRLLELVDGGKIKLLGLTGRWLEFETRRWEYER
jgi:CRISPR-associated protein Csm1